MPCKTCGRKTGHRAGCPKQKIDEEQAADDMTEAQLDALIARQMRNLPPWWQKEVEKMNGKPAEPPLKHFPALDLDEALAHAAGGGQSLHTHTFIGNPATAPRCFVRAVRRGEKIAHLFDQDIDRLRKTARQCGVKIIVVEHAGTDRQHIDLCGKPLVRAMELCGDPIE